MPETQALLGNTDGALPATDAIWQELGPQLKATCEALRRGATPKDTDQAWADTGEAWREPAAVLKDIESVGEDACRSSRGHG